MPVYNKLVRDRIPEIIEASNKTCSTRRMERDEFVKELRAKLSEELEEYRGAPGDKEAMEELADISELIHVLAEVHGEGIEHLEKIRKEKADQSGSFQERVYLMEVGDDA